MSGVEPPAEVNGVPQMPLEGVGFAASLKDADAPRRATGAVFSRCSAIAVSGSMAGRRWRSIRPERRSMTTSGNSILDADFSEVPIWLPSHPERLQAMIDHWWQEAAARERAAAG